MGRRERMKEWKEIACKRGVGRDKWQRDERGRREK